MNNPFRPSNAVRDTSPALIHSTLCKNSLYNPQISDNQHINVFKKLVLQDLESLKLKKMSDPIHIKKGTKLLTERNYIVIRPADKGGALVIQFKEQYQGKLNRQLQDEETYIKLLGNPTIKYKKELNLLVNLGIKKDILNKKESNTLYQSHVEFRLSVPKIHKSKENTPSRPIVNGIDSLTSRMGQYIDYFIQPAVQHTQAYLKDSKHLLQLLDTVPVLEGRTLLATADVALLYTLIQHHDACSVTKWLLRNHSNLICKQGKYLIKCLDF